MKRQIHGQLLVCGLSWNITHKARNDVFAQYIDEPRVDHFIDQEKRLAIHGIDPIIRRCA